VTSAKPKLVKDGSTMQEIKLSLFTAAVSVTLRVTAPVMGLFLVGLGIDFLRQETAFYAIVGAAVGLAVAALLVYLQIKQLKTKGQDPLINDPNGALESKSTKRLKEKK